MAYRMGDYVMLPPYIGNERNETGNELGIVSDFSLYNIKSDKAQQNNIAAQKPKILEQMKREFFKHTAGYYNPDVPQPGMKIERVDGAGNVRK